MRCFVKKNCWDCLCGKLKGKNKQPPPSAEAVTIPDWQDCTAFTPPITSGVVIKVYDGDTITVATPLPYKTSPLYRFPVRLRAIDAPEMRASSDVEKEAAKASQRALSGLVLHKTVSLENIGTEKYGRVLADVFTAEGLCVNAWMVEHRFAVPYDGGKKQPFLPDAK